MKWNRSLLCIAWGFSLIHCITYKHSKCQHDSYTQIHQRMHSGKKFCDPQQTAGPITQKCSSGFYREWTGPHRGQCVPCSCNGLSEECDEQTGHCVNCQFNTTGDHCEQCKEGYYGNAAIKTCRPCPCPFTLKNFALACLEISAGVVECLCKKGYSGARCERCGFGYYGDPMMEGGICKPCTCAGRCDHLTGECIGCENSSCNGDCEQDRCVHTLVVDLDEIDVGLTRTQQNITQALTFSSLKHLQSNTSKTKVEVGKQTVATRHLDLKVEQLEADVIAVRNDLSQLTNETLHTTSNGKFWQNVNGSKSQAQKLLFEAKGLLGAVQDLTKRQTHVKPEDPNALSEKDRSETMAKAQPIMQEIRARRCATQRNKAESAQEGANQLLNNIRNMSIPAKTFQTIPDSLMLSDVSLREVAELLLCAVDAVNRTNHLNKESLTTLQHLQHALALFESEQRMLHSDVVEFFSGFEKIKKELEKYSAQMDGARLELSKKLNKVLLEIGKVDNVAKAEEHAKQLNNLASELHQKLYNMTNSSERLRILGVGGYNNIIKALKTAESTANQSGEASFQALKVTDEGGLVIRAEEMKDNSSHLHSEAVSTQRHFKMLLRITRSLKERIKKQKKKGKSLQRDILTTGDDIKQIKRGTAGLLIQSAKAASSAANASISHMKERLKNISVKVGNLSASNINLKIDDMLTDARQALKSFNKELPVLNNKFIQIKARGEKTPFSANITENIIRIKDIIHETRNFVNRISAATTFNGKGHIEMHPPKHLEDLKAFTAVDFFLNRHHTDSPGMNLRRKRRQHRDGENNFFVFYLGNKNASEDYIGMAIRNTKLICVYKLGGVNYEMKTTQIIATDVNSPNFDRVFFRRVYQDAEVSITQNYTSRKPVSLSVRSLPDTLNGVFELDSENVVFYVGGYPRDFTPPEELRYQNYRGAIKFSYINNSPVCLFNYKRATNMDVKQPTVKIPQTEVADYYEGTGYRMAFIKDPERKKTRLIKFHVNSSETSALLFYIGNKDSFFCVSVERGFLVLRRQQGDKETRVQSPDRVSLSDKQFAIVITDKFAVHYGSKKISTGYTKSSYTRYYIGGLPTELRRRYNITAAPLRGCIDHLTADGEIVEYNKTIGVTGGCPVSMLGVRTATLFSSLAVESLFAWNELPRRISLSFRSKNEHAVLLKSSSEDFQLSLTDGFVVFKSYNCSLRSDKRYNDGAWHYLSAEWMPAGVKLSVDNVNLMLTKSQLVMKQDANFTVCITNIYARRPGHVLTPADLGMLSLTADIFPGQCRHHLPSPTELSAESTPAKPQNLRPILTPTSSECRRQQTQHEYQFSEENSWISYTLPQQDLDFRPHFSLHFKTKTSKGLILHVEGRGVVPMLALYIANGKIKMSLGLNRTIQHKQKSNDGNWHKVEISIEKNTFHLLVDGMRVTDGRLPNDEGSSLNFHNPVYLGGNPEGLLTKGQSIPKNSIIGCIRDFKMNDVFVSEPDSRRNILPCFDGRAQMGTYFGGGYIVLDNFFTIGSHFELSFELRPQLLRGLLFHLQSHQISLNVYLMETKVGVRMNDGNGAVSVSVKTPKNLCDGKFHAVQVFKNNRMIKLVVDSTSEEKENFFTSSFNSAKHSLYVGGVTKQHLRPVSSPFIGCMRNLKFNKKSVAVDVDSLIVGPVSTSKCPVEPFL